MQVQERRADPLHRPVAEVEQPGAARGPEVLAPGGGQHVAADPGHVDRQLSDRLAGVEHVEHVVLAAQRPHRLGRVHDPVAGRHVHQRDHRRAAAQLPLEGVEGDLAVLVVLHQHDLDTEPVAQVQQRDGVAGVLLARDQHPVAGLERVAVDREVPRPGGAVGQRDLTGLGPQQGRHRGVHRLDLVGDRPLRLVAADLGLALQVAHHGVEHLAGGQRAAGVVEVHHRVGARGVGAEPVEVEGQVVKHGVMPPHGTRTHPGRTQPHPARALPAPRRLGHYEEMAATRDGTLSRARRRFRLPSRGEFLFALRLTVAACSATSPRR